MSFSKQVKEEIIKKNLHLKNIKPCLQGLFVAAGSLVISNGKLSFVLSKENEDVINFIKQKLIKCYGEIDIQIVKLIKSFKNKERYELSVLGEDNTKVLLDLGIIAKDVNGEFEFLDFSGKNLKTKEDMSAFLLGAFLGSGSLSVPNAEGNSKKYGYHFEISVSSKEQADVISELFSNFDIFPKTIERNDMFVIYLKNSDVICDALAIFGASKIILDLINQRVSRDMNNLTNRQINCISANIDKTVNAALKQLQAIEVIQNTIGLENLPDNLSEVALLRLSNPEVSLKDLLELMEVKISKGALAQRFNKIIKIAQELGEDNAK